MRKQAVFAIALLLVFLILIDGVTTVPSPENNMNGNARTLSHTLSKVNNTINELIVPSCYAFRTQDEEDYARKKQLGMWGRGILTGVYPPSWEKARERREREEFVHALVVISKIIFLIVLILITKRSVKMRGFDHQLKLRYPNYNWKAIKIVFAVLLLILVLIMPVALLFGFTTLVTIIWLISRSHKKGKDTVQGPLSQKQ